MKYDSDLQKIPAAATTFEDAETMAYLASQGKTTIQLTLTPETLPDVESYNVIGDLKGSDKADEIVLVGGHLDSWDLGTGALDDACGVAVAMQVANLAKKLGLKPKRTIRVIAFMNEENGGRGFTAYFEENKTKLDKQFAAIETDLGASHPMGIDFAGKPETREMLEPLSKILFKQGAWLLDNSQETGVDIGPLREAGVPTFAAKTDVTSYWKYHHTPADTFDKIDPKELAELGSTVAVLTYGLANLNQALPR
jgi:Zn-dependent M28 family amino/carboxypeptidase